MQAKTVASATQQQRQAAVRPVDGGAGRRAALAKIAGALGAVALGTRPARAAAGSSSSSSAQQQQQQQQQPSAISFSRVDASVKETLERRDDAMDFQCKSMFDCDGDRRQFAHKQWMEWLESGGVPKRIRDGKPGGPRSY